MLLSFALLCYTWSTRSTRIFPWRTRPRGLSSSYNRLRIPSASELSASRRPSALWSGPVCRLVARDRWEPANRTENVEFGKKLSRKRDGKFTRAGRRTDSRYNVMRRTLRKTIRSENIYDFTRTVLFFSPNKQFDVYVRYGDVNKLIIIRIRYDVNTVNRFLRDFHSEKFEI